jgi:mono/diheme cytochrome c family protein
VTRIIANIALIFAAFVLAATSSLWQIPVPVPSQSTLPLLRHLSQSDPQSPPSPVPLTWGAQAYEEACAACHGTGSHDLGIGEQNLRPLGDYTPRDIHQLITWGHPVELPRDLQYTGKPITLDKNHPAFPAQLTDTERWAVAIYVYSGGGPVAAPDQEQLFGSQCADCHGVYGYGDGALASDLVPHPVNLRDTAWLANQSFNYIFEVIKNGKTINAGDSASGMSGMPAFGEILTEEEISTLTQGIFAWEYTRETTAEPRSTEGRILEGIIVPDFNPWTWPEIRAQLLDAPETEPAWMRGSTASDR